MYKWDVWINRVVFCLISQRSAVHNVNVARKKPDMREIRVPWMKERRAIAAVNREKRPSLTSRTPFLEGGEES